MLIINIICIELYNSTAMAFLCAPFINVASSHKPRVRSKVGLSINRQTEITELASPIQPQHDQKPPDPTRCDLLQSELQVA